MFSFATEVLTSRNSDTHLFSVGQAGFIIKSASAQLLAIDLYLSDCVERAEGFSFKRLLPKILSANELTFDILICTHPHLDHFDIDSVPSLISNHKTKLLCSANCKEYIHRLNLEYYREQIIYVKPGDSFCSGDFRVDFVDCDHGSSAPDAVGVVVNVDGRRIYEAGDTCLRLDILPEIPRPVDVLIAPINGAFGNLNEEECSILAEHLKPSITIPCHYGMFAAHHGDVGKFYDIMAAKKLPFLLLRQGENYTL